MMEQLLAQDSAEAAHPSRHPGPSCPLPSSRGYRGAASCTSRRRTGRGAGRAEVGWPAEGLLRTDHCPVAPTLAYSLLQALGSSHQLIQCQGTELPGSSYRVTRSQISFLSGAPSPKYPIMPAICISSIVRGAKCYEIPPFRYFCAFQDNKDFVLSHFNI